MSDNQPAKQEKLRDTTLDPSTLDAPENDSSLLNPVNQPPEPSVVEAFNKGGEVSKVENDDADSFLDRDESFQLQDSRGVDAKAKGESTNQKPSPDKPKKEDSDSDLERASSGQPLAPAEKDVQPPEERRKSQKAPLKEPEKQLKPLEEKADSIGKEIAKQPLQIEKPPSPKQTEPSRQYNPGQTSMESLVVIRGDSEMTPQNSALQNINRKTEIKKQSTKGKLDATFGGERTGTRIQSNMTMHDRLQKHESEKPKVYTGQERTMEDLRQVKQQSNPFSSRRTREGTADFGQIGSRNINLETKNSMNQKPNEALLNHAQIPHRYSHAGVMGRQTYLSHTNPQQQTSPNASKHHLPQQLPPVRNSPPRIYVKSQHYQKEAIDLKPNLKIPLGVQHPQLKLSKNQFINLNYMFNFYAKQSLNHLAKHPTFELLSHHQKLIGLGEFFKIFKDFQVTLVSQQELSGQFRRNQLADSQQLDFLSLQAALLSIFQSSERVVEVFHLDDKQALDLRLQGFSKPFNCGESPQKKMSPAIKTGNLSKAESLAHLKGSPDSFGFQMSPREKKALKHHLQIIKIQRQLRQNEKLKKLNIINNKRLKERLKSEQKELNQFEVQNPGKKEQVLNKLTKHNGQFNEHGLKIKKPVPPDGNMLPNFNGSEIDIEASKMESVKGEDDPPVQQYYTLEQLNQIGNFEDLYYGQKKQQPSKESVYYEEYSTHDPQGKPRLHYHPMAGSSINPIKSLHTMNQQSSISLEPQSGLTKSQSIHTRPQQLSIAAKDTSYQPEFRSYQLPPASNGDTFGISQENPYTHTKNDDYDPARVRREIQQLHQEYKSTQNLSLQPLTYARGSHPNFNVVRDTGNFPHSSMPSPTKPNYQRTGQFQPVHTYQKTSARYNPRMPTYSESVMPKIKVNLQKSKDQPMVQSFASFQNIHGNNRQDSEELSGRHPSYEDEVRFFNQSPTLPVNGQAQKMPAAASQKKIDLHKMRLQYFQDGTPPRGQRKDVVNQSHHVGRQVYPQRQALVGMKISEQQNTTQPQYQAAWRQPQATGKSGSKKRVNNIPLGVKIMDSASYEKIKTNIQSLKSQITQKSQTSKIAQKQDSFKMASGRSVYDSNYKDPVSNERALRNIKAFQYNDPETSRLSEEEFAGPGVIRSMRPGQFRDKPVVSYESQSDLASKSRGWGNRPQHAASSAYNDGAYR